MKRVSVIGCPGSGKSHFSRKLQEKTGLPLIHLDKVYHELEGEGKKDLWKNRLMQILEDATWITDGNYFRTQDYRLPRSDTVIIFDYSLRLVYWRLLKRRIMYSRSKRPDMPDDWQETLSLKFIKSHVLGFRKKYADHALPVIACLPAAVKVVVFKNPKDAEAFLSRIK